MIETPQYHQPLMEAEKWLDTPDQTVLYVEVNGAKTNFQRNYHSTQILQIVSGEGFVATDGLKAYVSEGDGVKIEKGMAYQYGGDMSLLISLSPRLIPKSVSGNPAGDRQARRFARRLSRRMAIDMAIGTLEQNIANAVLGLEASRNFGEGLV